jgi:hypothetical protein
MSSSSDEKEEQEQWSIFPTEVWVKHIIVYAARSPQLRLVCRTLRCLLEKYAGRYWASLPIEPRLLAHYTLSGGQISETDLRVKTQAAQSLKTCVNQWRRFRSVKIDGFTKMDWQLRKLYTGRDCLSLRLNVGKKTHEWRIGRPMLGMNMDYF